MTLGTRGAFCALAIFLCFGRALGAGPKVKSKLAHHRWFSLKNTHFDAAQVTIEFDQDLYLDGTNFNAIPTAIVLGRDPFLSFDCGDVGGYSPSKGGVPSPAILPSVPSNSMEAVFKMGAAEMMRTKQYEYREAKLIPPPMPQHYKELLEKPFPGQRKGLLNFLVVFKETNLKSGQETIVGPDPVKWTSNKCRVEFNITNANGELAAPATAEGWKDNTPVCSYPKFAPLPSRISREIQQVGSFNETRLQPGPFEVQAIIASDAFFGCATFLQEAIMYKDVNDTVTSKTCTAMYGSAEYERDPCCNMNLPQCCVPRRIKITRRQLVGVRGDLLKPKCSAKKSVLASVFHGIASYNAARRHIFETSDGCAVQYERAKRKLHGIVPRADACYDSVMGETSCHQDKDCKLSGRCLKDDFGDETGTCAAQDGDPVQNLQSCLRASVPKLVLSALKATWGVPQNASSDRFDAEFKKNTAQFTCVGPSGWKFRESWDDYAGKWVQPKEESCLNDKACNYDAADQDSCENGEMGGKFCGDCTGGGGCFEVSRAPKCMLGTTFWTPIDNHTCIKLGGVYRANSVDSDDFAAPCLKEVPTGASYMSNKTCYRDCFSAEGPEPIHLSTCEKQVCFNASVSENDCVGTPSGLKDAELGGLTWKQELKGGNGACTLDVWSDEVSVMTACSMVGWTYYVGAKFEEGFKYTKEQCKEGLCSLDRSLDRKLDKSECEATHTCTEECRTCAAGKLCFAETLTKEQCDDEREGSWDEINKVCKFAKVWSKDQCSSRNNTFTWIECEQLTPKERTGRCKELLGCSLESTSCTTEKECKDTGKCVGFPSVQDAEGYTADVLCVFGFDDTKPSSPRCNESLAAIHGHGANGWSRVMETLIGCVPTNLVGEENRDICRAHGGISVSNTKEECESTALTRCCPKRRGLCGKSELNYFDTESCAKCGYQLQKIMRWEGGRWEPGFMKALQWKNRTYGQLNEWVPKISKSKLNQELFMATEFLKAKANARSVACSYNNMASAIDQVACGCGVGHSSCKAPSATISVHEEAYAGTDQNVGFGIFATNASVDPSANNGVTRFAVTEISGHALQSWTSDGRRRLRSETEAQETRARQLAETTSDDNAPCFTVVTNDKGVYIGQIVGHCVGFTTSEPLSNSVELCLTVSSDIPQDSTAFPTFDFALRTESTGGAIIRPVTPSLDIESRDNGVKLCAGVKESGTYCPVRRRKEYSSATTSADTSCKSGVALVSAVLEGKTVTDVTQSDGGGGSSGNDPKESGNNNADTEHESASATVLILAACGGAAAIMALVAAALLVRYRNTGKVSHRTQRFAATQNPIAQVTSQDALPQEETEGLQKSIEMSNK